MMERIAGASPRQLARAAGGLYLINILGGFFAIGLVPGLLFVAGDAAATAHNIQANELLYRSGLLAHITIDVTAVFLAVIFYDLFRVVNRRLALLVVFFTLVATAVERVYGSAAPGSGVHADGIAGNRLRRQLSVLRLLRTHDRVPGLQVDLPPPGHRRAAGGRGLVLHGLRCRGHRFTRVRGSSGPLHPAALARRRRIVLPLAAVRRRQRPQMERACELSSTAIGAGPMIARIGGASPKQPSLERAGHRGSKPASQPPPVSRRLDQLRQSI